MQRRPWVDIDSEGGMGQGMGMMGAEVSGGQDARNSLRVVYQPCLFGPSGARRSPIDDHGGHYPLTLIPARRCLPLERR